MEDYNEAFDSGDDSDLENSMYVHNSENTCKCDTCGKVFRRHLDLIRHARLTHADERDLLTHTDEKAFYCTVCDKEISTSSNLAGSG